MNFLTASVDIKVDDSRLSTQLAKARSAVTKTVDKIKSSFTKMGASFKAVFSKMVKYAKLALVAITVASAKAFASFDDAMQKSVAIMKGVTAKIRLVMEKTASVISLNSVKSATELAKSYFYLASAGLSVEQSIKALSVVEAFAVAGAFDMALATDLVTDAQSALGLTVKDSIKNMENMKRITDVLIGANTLANASTQQFSEALMVAGPAMKAYGISLEEGTAVLAAYADQGKKATMGGEMFGRMLRLMIKGFVDNEAAWRGYGISIVDANDKMRPLADIVRDLTGLLDDMGVTQKARTLEMLGFQARSQQTILPLLGMGDAIERYNRELKNMGGITQRVRDFQLKSFAAQMKIVWNNIVSVGIAIGRRLAPHIEDLGNLFRENRDVIERWAVIFTDHVLRVKDGLWGFVKFMYSDWKAGIKYGLAVSKELFIGFADAIYVILQHTFFRLAKDVGSWTAQIFEEMLVRQDAYAKKFREETPWWSFGDRAEATKLATEAGDAAVKAYRKVKDKQRDQEFEAENSLADDLVQLAKGTAERIKKITPPELKAAEDGPFAKLPFAKMSGWLEEVGTAAEEIREPMEEALVDPIKKMTKEMEEAQNKMRQWADSAGDYWNNLADIATGALDDMADALTDFVMTGKLDFSALADSIMRDLTRMIIKAQMARMLGVVMPSLFGAAVVGGGGGGAGVAGSATPLQHGGTIKKTGLAIVHKGETYSGVNNENKQQGATLNISVNAIDAAGTYQFLSKNKRAIATMMQGMVKSNHPFRRTKGWK